MIPGFCNAMMIINPSRFSGGGGGGGDPHFANVVLLCGFDGADGSTTMTDESQAGRTLSVFGNAQLDTGVAPPFGTSSLLLDGTGDYLTAPDSEDFNFGTGDFTIEMFVRTAATANSNYLLVHAGSSGNISYTWRCNASNQQDVVWSTNGIGTFNLVGASGGVPLTTWKHLCFERSGSKLRLYADGVMETSSTTILASALFNSSAVLAIGMRSTSTTNGFNGHLKEIRITKGVARYNSDAGFTVPTAAFPRG
ncbi:MAG: LamG domain-containing protein [Mesorhizobium sp.]|nr:MAG: LamG domain-containing protein [Mesorhizobium sp.]TIN27053.1 MAG: LamG domain-containing protein [Mesorhizobium sp.]TIN41629.1 MAG: LamG domain-containing protein [Mesorhizobium sp.]TJU88534.1 MAG: LamG domain-containing protein [Mesorhizobium sp.]TJU88938.1 MAG: LamG domain-containing protein [Mesorhizobium sp.]